MEMDENNKPQLLKPDYFTKVGDRKVDFNRDHYMPFVERYEKAIHEIDPDWFICVDNVLFPLPHQLPDLKSLGDKNWVNGSHWYDDATLVTKQYIPWVGLLDDEIIIGKKNIRLAFEEFIGNMFKAIIGLDPDLTASGYIKAMLEDSEKKSKKFQGINND